MRSHQQTMDTFPSQGASGRCCALNARRSHFRPGTGFRYSAGRLRLGEGPRTMRDQSASCLAGYVDPALFIDLEPRWAMMAEANETTRLQQCGSCPNPCSSLASRLFCAP